MIADMIWFYVSARPCVYGSTGAILIILVLPALWTALILMMMPKK